MTKQVGVRIPEHPVEAHDDLKKKINDDLIPKIFSYYIKYDLINLLMVTTLFRLPKPSLLMASVFHWGRGGLKDTALGGVVGSTDCFSTPRGSVQSTASAKGGEPGSVVQGCAVVHLSARKSMRDNLY